MWTRKEIKEKAKIAFKGQYWGMVLVALLMSLLSGTSSAVTVNSTGGENLDFNSLVEGASQADLELFTKVSFAGLIAFGAVGFLIKAFAYNPLRVGCKKYFLNVSKGEGKFEDLLFAFKNGYTNVVITMLVKDIKHLLWTLLFIIPGIVKGYEYSQIPFILAEDPTLPTKEVFAKTKEMMDGNKWKTCVLDLSFIGWNLLSVLTLGILGIFYVMPYENQTDAQLYEVLKERA